MMNDTQYMLHLKNFDYYMNHAEEKIQDGIVDMIWKVERKKNFSKEAIHCLERCYLVTKHPPIEILYDLHNKTHESMKRIKQWFCNKRKRHAS
jgi:hypothetical protein